MHLTVRRHLPWSKSYSVSLVEKLFCATLELKKADEAMSAAYCKLLRRTSDPELHEALIRSQRRWLGVCVRKALTIWTGR
jgi:uncharacterized protein YecT (DUF1311 family)